MSTNKVNLPETIDIYVPDECARTVRNDAALFEFYGKAGAKAVLNEFLATLIIQYRSVYISDRNRYLKDIMKIVAPHIHDGFEHLVANQILDQFLFPEIGSKTRNNISRFRLKRNKKLKRELETLTDDDIGEEAVSRYFRNIIISYCKKPIHEREQYIFRENYETLKKACKDQTHLKLSISTDSGNGKLHYVIPYQIVTSTEEIFNYLVCEEIFSDGNSRAATFRLNRISRIEETPGDRKISNHILQNIEKMKAQSPQFAINDDKRIRVRLSEDGLEQYRKIYYGRPRQMEFHREGNAAVVSFDCSVAQAFLYFRRFEQNTIEVLSPDELRNEMKTFFQKAVLPWNLETEIKTSGE